MINIKMTTVITAAIAMLLTSACGNELTTNTSASNMNQKSETTQKDNTTNPNQEQEDKEASVDTTDNVQDKKEILIVIDQTKKPSTGNSFDFFVNKVPEGYSLVEMQWVSGNSDVKNTIQEAIEHGNNGEDGFYISGNGQFSGFIYSNELKGETGKVIFIFQNDQGNELTWEKEIILK